MEKKQIKMSLGTFVVSIIVIIFVIVVVIIGIRISNQNKDISITDNNKFSSISDDKIIEMAKVTLEKYERILPYTSKTIGPMPYLLVELGLDTRENLEKLEKLEENVRDTSTYIKTNTKYVDFKNEMLKYVTEELFDREYSLYINMDDYVGVKNVAGGWIPTTVSKVELISKNENEYTFKVTYRDEEMYSHYLNPEVGETILESDCYLQGTVICEYINGYLVVSKDLENS